MTKIWVLSDFQLDINDGGSFSVAPDKVPDADVLVVAGDFYPPLINSVLALGKIAQRMPVVYVPGNRDYYNASTIEEELKQARRAAGTAFTGSKGFHILDNETVVVAGTRFVGATLWTDLKFQGGPDVAAPPPLNDFDLINVLGSGDGDQDGGAHRFTPQEYVRRHAISRRFIEDTLAVPFDGLTVVVSHHSPHRLSVGERYAANRRGTNAFFHSDLSEILEGPNAPDLWVHGATHVGVDYRVGATRVLSNPYGYRAQEENPKFSAELVVDPSETSYEPAY